MKGFDPAMLGEEMTKRTPSRVDDTLASKGRGNDSLIAHLSPREAAVLKALGGSGKINPETGLLEFWDGGDEGGSATDTDSGANGPSGEASDPGGGGGGYGPGVDAYGENEGVGVGGLADGLSEDDQGSRDAILGDMAAAAEHNNSIAAGGEGTEYGATDVSSIAELDHAKNTPVQNALIDPAINAYTSAKNTLSAVNKAYDDFMADYPAVKGALHGWLAGGISGAVIGAFGAQAYDMAKNFDPSSPEAKAAFEAASSPALTGNEGPGGFSPDIAPQDYFTETETAPISTSSTQTASASVKPAAYTGRIVTKPAYKFNRQMVGVSAKNIYPERV